MGKGSCVGEEKQRLTKAWDDFVNAGALDSTRLRATKGV